jgi:hypothetical protein
MYLDLLVLLGPALTSPPGAEYNLKWKNITMGVQVLLTHGLYPWFAY